MRTTLTELIERAYDIKVYFNLGHYELHHYDDGSFVDFHVQKVTDLPTLQRLAGDLEIKFLSGEGYIIVRLFERESD